MTTIHGRNISLVVIIIVAMSVSSDAEARSLQDEHHCLALTLYWEARGEGHRGMTAVGWTVLNRVRSSYFPSTPCDVVFQGGEQPPCQFSYWCDGKSDRPRDRRGWKTALVIAANLLVDPPRDPTYGGSTNINWTDGPNSKQVERLVSDFEGSYFDAWKWSRPKYSKWESSSSQAQEQRG